MPTMEAHIKGRQAWDERYGGFVRDARRWRWAAAGALGVALLSVTGMILVAMQPSQVPYIVEVDRNMVPIQTYPAAELEPHTPEMIKAILARWMRDFRLVTMDPTVQRDAVMRVYAHLVPNYAARKVVDEWYQANRPSQRAESMTVHVDVQQVLRLSPSSWRVEWLEESRGRHDGELLERRSMVATLTIVQHPVAGSDLMQNPTGTYIVSLDWSAA